MPESQIIATREEQKSVEETLISFTCNKCGLTKPSSEFYRHPGRKTKHFAHCKGCHLIMRRDWISRNREKWTAYQRAYVASLKEELYAHYGDRCTCCGETEKKFLEVDHINNDGAEHRRLEGKWLLGKNIISWLKKNNWPPNFQLLCTNCNMAKARYGICPHQEKVTSGVTDNSN